MRLLNQIQMHNIQQLLNVFHISLENLIEVGECAAGLEPNQDGHCVPCREDHFKPGPGYLLCQVCPSRMRTHGQTGSTGCGTGLIHIRYLSGIIIYIITESTLVSSKKTTPVHMQSLFFLIINKTDLTLTLRGKPTAVPRSCRYSSCYLVDYS